MLVLHLQKYEKKSQKLFKILLEIAGGWVFFFWPHHMACRILVPQPGIEPMSPTVEV